MIISYTFQIVNLTQSRTYSKYNLYVTLRVGMGIKLKSSKK